jgi:hypothetical protein
MGCPEEFAVRLILAFDADNPDALEATMDEFISCQSCSRSVITSLVAKMTPLLDACYGPDWRPAATGRLAHLLEPPQVHAWPDEDVLSAWEAEAEAKFHQHEHKP